MRIGFDAKRAARNVTGLGNYSRTLITNLEKYFPGAAFFLYSPALPKEGLRMTLMQSGQLQFRIPGPVWRWFAALWRSIGITRQIKKDKLDIYHGLSGELPFIKSQGTRFILTVHDVIWLRFPEYYTYIDRSIYTMKLHYSLKAADSILAISEQTASDLVAFTGTNRDKIKIIYQACDPSFGLDYPEATHSSVKHKHNLPDIYLLCVATLEPRKNQLLILQALVILAETTQTGSLKEACPPLVLVGRKTQYYTILWSFLVRHGIGDKVIFLEQIPQHDLVLIVQNARLVVYPSRFEGFGIPILEALMAGVPVISSKGSCFEEAGGPDSLYADPDDPLELATHIRLILTSTLKRKEMITRGLIFARKFSGQTLSAELMNEYSRVSGKPA